MLCVRGLDGRVLNERREGGRRKRLEDFHNIRTSVRVVVVVKRRGTTDSQPKRRVVKTQRGPPDRS